MAIERRSNVGPHFDSEHPAARSAADCDLQLEICRSLLTLADSLPGHPDRKAIAHLVKVLPASLAAHTAFQSEVAFPLLKRRSDEQDIAQWLDQREQEHLEIGGLDDELIEQLVAVQNGEIVDVDILGYVVRNAAERRRQHVELERSMLDQLLPSVLAPVERQAFAVWSATHPWPLGGIENGGTEAAGDR